MSSPTATIQDDFVGFAVSYPGWVASVSGPEQPRSMSSAWIDRVNEREARVFSDSRFEVGQWVELCVRLPEENRSISGKAKVEWVEWSDSVKLNSGFRWVLGLSLGGVATGAQRKVLDEGVIDRA